MSSADTANRSETVANHFHLAQFNIGKMRHPRQAPEMADYNETLNRVQPVALARPGSIWIMDDDIIGMAERQYGQRIAANLSVWSDIESLTLQKFSRIPSRYIVRYGHSW